RLEGGLPLRWHVRSVSVFRATHRNAMRRPPWRRGATPHLSERLQVFDQVALLRVAETELERRLVVVDDVHQRRKSSVVVEADRSRERRGRGGDYSPRSRSS